MAQVAQAGRLCSFCSSQRTTFYVDKEFNDTTTKLMVRGLEFVADGTTLRGSTKAELLEVTLSEVEGKVNDGMSLKAEGNIEAVLEDSRYGRHQVTLAECIVVKPGYVDTHVHLVKPRIYLCIQGRPVYVDLCSFDADIKKKGEKTQFNLALALKITTCLPRIFPRIGNNAASNALGQATCVLLAQTRQEIINTLNSNEETEVVDIAAMLLRALKKVSFEDDAVIKVEIKPKEVIDLIKKGVIKKGDTIIITAEKAPVQAGDKILFYVLKDSEWEVIAVKNKWIGVQWKEQTGWIDRKYVDKK